MSVSDKKAVAVAVNNIHKEFILPQSKNSTFKQTVVNIVKKNKKVTQKVLDGVSFEVNKGDFFGIVGRNGCGKSTLLKLIAGVYTPTAGEIKINGGLTPFIELGVGFNPELSGRDNVYLNGALLGFNRKQMDKMYDEIVEFAELTPFMDQKLKNYSSGMQVRLAFSIAIKAKNEILIFDEVLAVGDEAFQRKCLDVFEKYKAEGQTVILVTHNMETVRQFCNRALLLKDGKILQIGDPQEIADKYSRLNQEVIDEELSLNSDPDNSNIKLTIIDPNTLKARLSFETGEYAILDISWEKNEAINDLVVDLFKYSGEHITGFKASKDGIKSLKDKDGVKIQINMLFSPGKYYFSLSLRSSDDKEYITAYQLGEFSVIKNWSRAGQAWSGLMPVDHKWTEIR
jgi:ABC-2 type transport system ATP-binding protein